LITSGWHLLAKGFALAGGIPLIEVNHLHAHVLVHFILDKDGRTGCLNSLPMPSCFRRTYKAIVMKSHLEMEIIGNTIDDAAGGLR
jgi:N6-L-threonylcarbamoyladenine synthase